jgi:hypothetical protein
MKVSTLATNEGHGPEGVCRDRGCRNENAFIINRGGKQIRVRETWVNPSTYTIPDRGKPGRGLKAVPPLRKGALGDPGFFDLSKGEREKIVFERARKVGEKK